MLPFKVQKKYAKGPEQLVSKFDSINDAKKYIQERLAEDARLKVACTYILYDMGEAIESFDQSTRVDAPPTTTAESAGGQGKSSSANFRPTPLQTTLRPSGMPVSNFKNEDEKEKK